MRMCAAVAVCDAFGRAPPSEDALSLYLRYLVVIATCAHVTACQNRVRPLFARQPPVWCLPV